MKYYRTISLLLAIIFLVVGLTFLFFANGVLAFFNGYAAQLGMAQTPPDGVNFYLILAAGYMYLVTLLAFFMYRHPGSRKYPLLLANAKLCSSLLSLGFFLLVQPCLIYLANCLVDGFIGIVALFFYFKIKAQQ